MKLVKITTFYNDYLESLYRTHQGIECRSYDEQKSALNYDGFAWADFWAHALRPLGYDVMEIIANAGPLQRAWAAEHSLRKGMSLPEIALAQIKEFRPDVIWFEDYNEVLLKAIKAEVPSIKLALGWVGSAIPRSNVFRHLDLVLSCAQESVDFFKNGGLSAVQLHHGFDPRINERIISRTKQYDFIFIGQLIRVSQFHLQREQMLERLATAAGIEIFSPSAAFGWKEDIKFAASTLVHYGVRTLKAAGVKDSMLRSLPAIRRTNELPSSKPLRPVNPALKPYLRPAVYGMDMYQVLRDSRMTLNIHADSSPRFASNMRLFEITGVGTCMLTDWRDNLTELFDPDREVATYRSVDECIEKASWLMSHPKERDAIAVAGQARTLRDHTYSQRALIFDTIIRHRMSGRT